MAFAEHYLRDPGQFPARRAGEPWGDCEVGFRFAGAAYLFRGMNAAQADQVRERFGSELDAPGNRTPDAVEIAVFQTVPSLFRPVVYEETEYRWDTDYEHRVIRIAGDGFMARIDRRPGLLGALWLPHAAGPFQLNELGVRTRGQVLTLAS